MQARVSNQSEGRLETRSTKIAIDAEIIKGLGELDAGPEDASAAFFLRPLGGAVVWCLQKFEALLSVTDIYFLHYITLLHITLEMH